MEGWKRKTASVVARDGGMDRGCGSFYGSLKSDRAAGARNEQDLRRNSCSPKGKICESKLQWML